MALGFDDNLLVELNTEIEDLNRKIEKIEIEDIKT